MTEVQARPRYHTYLLRAGSTDEGAFQGAFFRFKANFLGSCHDLNVANQVVQHGPAPGRVMIHQHRLEDSDCGAPAFLDAGWQNGDLRGRPRGLKSRQLGRGEV